MKCSLLFAIQISFFGFAPTAFCQALEETTALLNNQGARDAAIKNDAGAKAADQQVKDLGLSSAGQAKVYELSAKIFEKLNLNAGGDPQKVNDQVNQLVRNPAQLDSVLTPDQKQEIHTLSEEPVDGHKPH